MNRGFRKKYMRLTALLLSVAVVSGSMDINMLQVQAAQEQSTVAEETVSGGMDPTELTDAADPQEDAEQGKESEPQDTISAGNDEEQYENPAINDGENSAGSQDGAQSDADAGLQEDEKPEDTVGENGADTGDAEDGQEEPNEDTVSENNVNSPVEPSEVKPLADGDADTEPVGPVKVGVTISGIAIADKIYDGKPDRKSTRLNSSHP